MDIANQIIVLLTGLAGLVAAAVSAFFAIKNFIAATKQKSSSEIWTLIQNLADAAMKEAEASLLSGADKKELVINTVKAGCQEAGLDIDDFIDQLGNYIDQTISFVNDMQDKATSNES